MFCRKCGSKIPDDSEFCYKCGARVLADTTGKVTLEKNVFDKPPTVQDSSTETKRVCKCGYAVNSQYTRWCPICGEKLPVLGVHTDVEDQSYDSKFDNSCNDSLLMPPQSSNSHSANKGAAASQSASLPASGNNAPRDNTSPSGIVTTAIVTKCISIIALAIALFIEFIIAGNISADTYDGIMYHNTAIIFSYVFYGIFFCCLVIRIICAFILAGQHGELKGIGIFFIVGLIITTIAAAITKSWLAPFALFGIIFAAYTASKIREFM